MNTTERDEVEIDLKELFFALRSKVWIIILVTVLAAGAGFGVTKFMITPMYQSTTKLYVVSKTQSVTNLSLSDLQLGSQLTKDYMILVNSRPVTEQVIANLGLDMTHEELLSITTISNPSDTRILQITIEYPDAYMAKEIADEVASVSAQRMAEIMDMDEPRVVEEGHVAKYPSSPSTMKNTAIAGAIGLFITAFIIAVLYIMDDTIKCAEDISRHLGLTTIGLVPVEEDKIAIHKKKKRQHAKKR